MSDQNTDVISRLSEFLSIDREEVVKRLEELDVDATMEVLDAVNNDDAERVAELMSASSNEDTESSEEQDVDELSPLFTKTRRQKRKEAQDEAPEIAEADDTYVPNIGAAVRIGDDQTDPSEWQDAVVKVVRGPNDTVGVMIDGEITMVHKNEVHPIKEGVLGMTAMPAIQRMQELAGIAPSPDASPVQVQRVGTVATPGGVDIQALPVATSDDVDPALCQVMTCLDDVESALGDLKVKDAKNVRARLNAMVAKLNEAAQRPRKPL